MHHSYVFNEDSAELQRHLVFRDWLRSHPEDRDTYGKIKTQLAALFPYDIDAYIAGKCLCIETI